MKLVNLLITKVQQDSPCLGNHHVASVKFCVSLIEFPSVSYLHKLQLRFMEYVRLRHRESSTCSKAACLTDRRTD